MGNKSTFDGLFFIDPISKFQKTYQELEDDLSNTDIVSGSETYSDILIYLRGMKIQQAGETQVSVKFSVGKKPISLETSGTTGTPRRVHYSGETLTRKIKTGPEYRNNIWGLTYPINKFAGLQVLFQAISNGNPLVQLNSMEHLQTVTAIETSGITHLSATPTYFRMLLRGNCTFPKVKQVTSGGEPLDMTTLNRIRITFPNAKFTNIYATTETGVLLKSPTTWFQIPTNLKEQLRIEEDRLLVHSSLLGEFRGKPKGFYDTGDRIDIISDDPLRFAISGRAQDFVNVGGSMVNLQQVENALLSLPEIEEAKVYGRKNSVMGFIIGCELVTNDERELDAHEVRKKLLESLPAHAVPMIIEQTKSIARNASGKKVRK